MTAYYNEIDPYAAQWLRNLIEAGHIAPGIVDERSIADVQPAELVGYEQCHFFAGIGGWSLGLRLAGWPDDRPVWTGSCPCQPFSAAGKRKGSADDRHLWPHWFRLIRERCPTIVFGEQVARAIGKTWLDAVAHDLEQQDYAFGSAVLPACAVAAPHVRARIWFVAHADGAELRDEPRRSRGANGESAAIARAHGAARHVADSNSDGRQGPLLHLRRRGQDEAAPISARDGAALADADSDERHGRSGLLQMGWGRGASEAEDNAPPRRIEWPAEPDLPRVAHGVSGRVAKLRALGNAIVPQVAAEFIACAVDR